MITRTVLALVLVSVLVALQGCAAKTVRCDTKLTPINAPAPPPLPIEAPEVAR